MTTHQPMKTEHRKFQKIPRLFRDVVITEKIDGTNGLICINEDGSMQVGSRNRWLSAESDNHGFYAWTQMHMDDLLGLGPGMHYGEWWGKGIQRGYGLDHQRFSLFNVGRWNEDNIPSCCHVVPILYTGPLVDVYAIEEAVDMLLEVGSMAAPGFKDPEGLVLMHKPSGHLYKFTFGGDGLGQPARGKRRTQSKQQKKQQKQEALYDECSV